MAITTSPVTDTTGANVAFVVTDITFDNNYVTGGYAVTPTMFGLKSISFLSVQGKGAGSRLFEFNGSSGGGNIKIFTAVGTEAANASDQSAIVARVLAVGPHA